MKKIVNQKKKIAKRCIKKKQKNLLIMLKSFVAKSDKALFNLHSVSLVPS